MLLRAATRARSAARQSCARSAAPIACASQFVVPVSGASGVAAVGLAPLPPAGRIFYFSGHRAFGSDADAQAGHRPLSDAQRQRTLIALKPDCVQRNLCGAVLGRFEQKGFKLVGLKLVQPTRAMAEAHYAEHAGKPFFPRACRFLCSGPVVASVWEGLDVIPVSRKLIGATNPVDSAVGTIRGDYASHFRRNLVHGSDSPEAAAREIALWFREDELFEWDHSLANWVYELANAPVGFADDAAPECHPGHLTGPVGGTNPDLAFKG